MWGKSKRAPSLVEKSGCELRGHARAARKYEAYMSGFRGLEQTATKMGRISPVYLMPMWEVMGVKQMHCSNVSLHLPTKTRIPMLINKILALHSARPWTFLQRCAISHPKHCSSTEPTGKDGGSQGRSAGSEYLPDPYSCSFYAVKHEIWLLLSLA